MNKFLKPFRMGDVVKIGEEKHIIHEVSLEDDLTFCYSTNRGAWFDHPECILVEECNKKSIKKLAKDIFNHWC